MQESLDLNLVQVMESIIMSDDDPISREKPLLAYAASSDPDILTLPNVIKAPDREEFREAMLQEFDSHCGKKHWLFVLQSSLPRRTKVLQSVWAIRHKRRIATGKIHTWKGCLIIHCRHQVKDVPSMLLNEGDSSTTEGATRATQFIEPHAVNPTTNVPSMLSNEGGSSTTEGATRATHLIEAPTMDPTANVPSTNEGDSSTTEGATRATSPTSAVQATAPSLLHPLPWEPLVEYVGTGEEPDLLPPPYEDVENVGAEDPIPPLVPMQESAMQGTDVTVRRSNHTKRPSWRKQEYIDSHLVQVMESIVVSDDDPISGEQPLLAYADSSDPDILTLSQLIKPKRTPSKANTIL